MDTSKIEQLEKKGFVLANVSNLLGLSPTEEKMVDTGYKLSKLVRETRQSLGVTQTQLAERLGTSQPNIVRLESGISTTFDKQFTALYEMGLTSRQIGEALIGV